MIFTINIIVIIHIIIKYLPLIVKAIIELSLLSPHISHVSTISGTLISRFFIFIELLLYFLLKPNYNEIIVYNYN